MLKIDFNVLLRGKHEYHVDRLMRCFLLKTSSVLHIKRRQKRVFMKAKADITLRTTV